MILSLISVLAFSMLSRYLFESGKLPPSWDVLRCVVNIPEDVVRVSGSEVEPHEGEMAVMTGLTDVRKYSATDEMNGRVNPALNLGSDSDEEAAHLTTSAVQKAKMQQQMTGGGSIDSPSHRPMISNRKASNSTSIGSAAAGHQNMPAQPNVAAVGDRQTTLWSIKNTIVRPV